MSRVAKKPITIPAGVEVKINGQEVNAKGAKGQESVTMHRLVAAKCEGNEVLVEQKEKSIFGNAIAGTTRALLNNMILGVADGFERKLLLVGVGYRAQVQGKKLNLTLGLSHPVNYEIPEGIKIDTPQPTEIVVTGINKQLVGQVAANIRRYRPPEPYKGKGIRYADEVISLKETKKK